ncbi:hypothetical protein BU16DRAFT_566233 [Lophium mytilinum]|uniref:Uncharacterized protein n=1 Tax=Lophium mytilinum TaxID=390894 RepID=A0A6A6QDS4_9PEZI|nr:hypothetical protein BU16DRAFT_566233 [Lophium mytilinum]
MNHGKRPREPEGNNVEEIPRLRAPGIEVLHTAFKKVLISFEGHEVRLGVRLAPNGTVEIGFKSNSASTRWIKDETREEAAFLNRLVLRPVSTQRRCFPFMKLPAEIRLMIYELVVNQYPNTVTKDEWFHGSTLRPTIDGTCLPTDISFGPMRKLLVMNKQMRAEVSVMLFRTFQLDFNFDYVNYRYFDEKGRCDLSITRDVLDAIGPLGRANIKKLRIRWWDARWESVQDRSDPAFANVAMEVADLLRQCGKLEQLHVVIPKQKALGKTGLKPRHFSKTCAFGELRAVTNVSNVRIHSPGDALKEWLLEGMTGSKVESDFELWSWWIRSW